MNKNTFISLVFCLGVINLGCTKEYAVSQESTPNEKGSALLKARGATQLDGVGYFDAADGCNAAGQGAAYAVSMTGGLEGCLYIFIDDYNCSPSGTYREVGREYFVGTYNGKPGTFWTAYKFESKYEGCAANGSYLGAEIFGRCQHPIVESSGTGVFQGVSGRLDMKDNVTEGNYPYRGHLRF